MGRAVNLKLTEPISLRARYACVKPESDQSGAAPPPEGRAYGSWSHRPEAKMVPFQRRC